MTRPVEIVATWSQRATATVVLLGYPALLVLWVVIAGSVGNG
jgi:hypothetical protein